MGWTFYRNHLDLLMCDLHLDCSQTNRLHGLQKISCALALLLHHQLPIEWVRDIFSVPFLDTLDHEIATCVSKVNNVCN